MTLRLNATVVDVDPHPETPSVTLASGEVVRGDLVVGADGIKSLTQRVVQGYTQPAELSGDAAYRIVIPAHKLLEDPDLRSLVEVPEMTGWMGPGRHIMAYNIVCCLHSPLSGVTLSRCRRLDAEGEASVLPRAFPGRRRLC